MYLACNLQYDYLCISYSVSECSDENNYMKWCYLVGLKGQSYNSIVRIKWMQQIKAVIRKLLLVVPLQSLAIIHFFEVYFIYFCSVCMRSRLMGTLASELPSCAVCVTVMPSCLTAILFRYLIFLNYRQVDMLIYHFCLNIAMLFKDTS